MSGGTLNYGLKVGYHMETTADFSGNGNTLTFTGTTLTTDKDGIANKARSLNGTTSDYITLSGLSSYSGAVTLSAWVNKTQNASYLLYSTNSGTNNVFNIGLNSGVIGFYDGSWRNSTQSIGTGSWHHLVWVFDGVSSYDLYIDGVLAQANITYGGTVDLSGTASISRSGYPDFGGKIDEFRLYDRALTETEILQLYYGYDTSEDRVGTLNEDLEVGYHMEDTSDFSGNGNTLTFNGTTLTPDKNSVADKARLFNGTSDYADTNVSLNGLTNFSISCWLNINSTQIDYSGLVFGRGTEVVGLFLYQDLSKIRVYDGVGAYIDIVSPPTDEWIYVTMTRSLTENKVYINGVLNNEGSCSGGVDAGDILLGWDTYSSARKFKGKIDEVRLYDRALTPYEVYQLFVGYDSEAGYQNTLATNCEAYYNLDGDVLDATGNGNNGTNHGTDLTATGIVNEGVESLSTDYIDTGIETTGTIKTIWFWMKSNNVASSTIEMYALGGNISTNYTQVSRRGDIAGDPFYVYGTDSAGYSYHEFANFVTSTSVWYFIVAECDGTTTNLYVNTVKQTQTGGADSAGDCYFGSLTVPIDIAGQRSQTRAINGKMDEVGIMSRKLFAEEITYLYADGSPSEEQQYPFTSDDEVKKNALFFGGGL